MRILRKSVLFKTLLVLAVVRFFIKQETGCGGCPMATYSLWGDGMNKSITVNVERRYKHAKYGKYVLASKRFVAHDENDEARSGDMVEIPTSSDGLSTSTHGPARSSAFCLRDLRSPDRKPKCGC